MLDLAEKAGLLDGYLENQVFAPAVTRGKDIVWARGAALAGPPYLARAAEEHSGPHMPWFWEGSAAGRRRPQRHDVPFRRGSPLHADAAGRTARRPDADQRHGPPNCLKWQEPKYAEHPGRTRAAARPTTSTGRPRISPARWSSTGTATGKTLVVETTTSWCYVGAGLRLSMELLGPEYALSRSTPWTPDSRCSSAAQVKGKAGEDLVEKQNAEIGLMPVVAAEEVEYGYTAENRHMVRSFLDGRRPEENFADGVDVTELLMAAYMSAETGTRPCPSPPPAWTPSSPPWPEGKWNPKNEIRLRGEEHAWTDRTSLHPATLLAGWPWPRTDQAAPVRHPIPDDVKKAGRRHELRVGADQAVPLRLEAWTFRKLHASSRRSKSCKELGIAKPSRRSPASPWTADLPGAGSTRT